jgi:hypothetical protein
MVAQGDAVKQNSENKQTLVEPCYSRLTNDQCIVSYMMSGISYAHPFCLVKLPMGRPLLATLRRLFAPARRWASELEGPDPFGPACPS